jgi:hypothetical protein
MYQNEIINGGKHLLSSLYLCWIADSYNGDTALCQNM